MGSPFSLVKLNFFMKKVEQQTINTVLHQPKVYNGDRRNLPDSIFEGKVDQNYIRYIENLDTQTITWTFTCGNSSYQSWILEVYDHIGQVYNMLLRVGITCPNAFSHATRAHFHHVRGPLSESANTCWSLIIVGRQPFLSLFCTFAGFLLNSNSVYIP